MVLLDEPPSTPPHPQVTLGAPPLTSSPDKLIHEVLSNFNISSDVQSLSRINETLFTIAETRTKTLDESRNLLRALSRRMEIAKQSMEASVLAAAKAEHGQNMLLLDREKFSLAKNINELESSSHHLEGQLARLKEELESDGEDAIQTAMMEAEDGTLLKLKVYRSLGIEIQEDGAGGYNKAVIRKPCLALPRGVGWRLTLFCLQETRPKGICTWSISRRSSRSFSMPTTSGVLCELGCLFAFCYTFVFCLSGGPVIGALLV